MDGKRQYIQQRLAFMDEPQGEAPRVAQQGTEPSTVKRETESRAREDRLMEEVCERDNLVRAWKQVRGNKGSPGVDGKTIDETWDDLREHWPAIREQLLQGTYQPQPARRVEIPKPGGGVRKLGIPTVLDRLIQQAVLQVLQRGYQWVVDIDLEKFFDRVNHDLQVSDKEAPAQGPVMWEEGAVRPPPIPITDEGAACCQALFHSLERLSETLPPPPSLGWDESAPSPASVWGPRSQRCYRS